MCKSVKDSCPFAKLNIVPDVQQRKRRGAINMVAVEHLKGKGVDGEHTRLFDQEHFQTLVYQYCMLEPCIHSSDSIAINHLLVMKVLVSCLL